MSDVIADPGQLIFYSMLILLSFNVSNIQTSGFLGVEILNLKP